MTEFSLEAFRIIALQFVDISRRFLQCPSQTPLQMTGFGEAPAEEGD
jgi:hypothetical protein